MNEQYGGRGLNFRAAHNRHGITMLICGAFPNQIARDQTLMRVGHFTDNCTRIQDTTFAEIDEAANAKRKSEICSAMQKIAAD